MKKLFVVLAMLTAMNASGQWVQMSNGMEPLDVYTFASIGSTLFAGIDEGLFKSTNDGINWVRVDLYNYKQILSLATSGNNFYAGTGDSGVYISTNNGVSWAQTALNDKKVFRLATNGNNIFAGVQDFFNPSIRGVYVSTNNGTSWTRTSLNDGSVVSFLIIGNTIFAGTDNRINNSGDSGGIFMSTNNGLNWSQTSYNGKAVWSLAKLGNNLFAGTCNYNNNPSGVYISTNDGLNWTQTSLNDKNVLSLATYGNNIFAGIFDNPYSSGVYLSSNNGISWIAKNQGFSVLPPIRSFLITSNYIYTGTNGQSVWRRNLSEVIGIQNISTELPFKYSLLQNYPNPFNPTTSIEFSISKTSAVKVLIYDDMGRELQTLVNETLPPGYFNYKFDGADFPSGVYFYKMIVNGLSETKRMLLIK